VLHAVTQCYAREEKRREELKTSANSKAPSSMVLFSFALHCHLSQKNKIPQTKIKPAGKKVIAFCVDDVFFLNMPTVLI
jgi:hypothetical protein